MDYMTSMAIRLGMIRDTMLTRAMVNMTPTEIATILMVQATVLAITRETAVMVMRSTMHTTKRWQASSMLTIIIVMAVIMVCMIIMENQIHNLMPIMDTTNMAN